jgi:threonine dehydratase
VLVTIDDVRAAATRVAGVAPETPLVSVGPATAGAHAFALKCEHLGPIGAFKLRGAYNLIAQLTPAQRAAGVITYSSGNHGQAVARSALLLGIRAVVVMPTHAPAIKIEKTRGYGAEVILEGTTSLHRQARAEAEARARGLTMVPPFDDLRTIAGAGTVGLEIVARVPSLRAVFVPIGGGGLASGIAVVVKALRPEAAVIGVEPEGAACMAASLAAGRPTTLERTASIADGLLPVRPGDLTFLHVVSLVDEVRTVADPSIVKAMRWIYDSTGMRVEPSGAVSVAAALEAGPPESGVVAVISGGNIDPADFDAAMATARGEPFTA